MGLSMPSAFRPAKPLSIPLRGIRYAGLMGPLRSGWRTLAVAAAALFLSACSSPASDGHTDHKESDQPVITGQPAGYNADDVAFATNMIPHHQQAVELSAMVPDRSTNAELIALASRSRARSNRRSTS